jgi:hypothetical protein
VAAMAWRILSAPHTERVNRCSNNH